MSTIMKNISIRNQILFSFVIFCVLALTVTGAIMYYFTQNTGSTTITRSNQATIDMIKQSMLSTAEQNALVIERKFNAIEQIVRQVSTQALEAFAEDSSFGYRRSYFDLYFHPNFTNLNEMPPDAYQDQRYRQYISWNYSTYYFPGSDLTNYRAVSSIVNHTIQRSAHLDHAFKAGHQADPDLAWIYMGFHRTGVFRNYPGATLGDDRTWDPRTDDWYQEGLVGNGRVVVTEPYVEGFGEFGLGLMISFVQQVTLPNQSILGVVGADLTTGTLRQILTNVTLLQSGYAALISPSGLVIAHPNMTETSPQPIPSFWDLERNDDGTSTISDSLKNQILSGNSGIVKYVRNGELQYLAHVPVGDTGYVLVTVVKESEALAPLTALNQRLESSLNAALEQFFVFMAIIVVIAIIVGLFVASHVVRPLDRLSEIATRLTSDNIRESITGSSLEIDDELLERPDEIGDLARSFKHLLETLEQQQYHQQHDSRETD